MKISLIRRVLFTSLFILILLACFFESSGVRCANLKSSSKTLKAELKTKFSLEMRSKWDQLFSQVREDNCVLLLNEKNTDPFEEIKRKKDKGKFHWVKAWGYDNAAYLFDFLDPVLRDPVVKEFKNIYNGVMGFSTVNPNKTDAEVRKNSTDYDIWEDPYDIKKMDTKQAEKIDFSVYNVSVNTVQLNQAIDSFKWNKDETAVNFGKRLVGDYDFNNDGRLNPRELIIGILRNNDEILGTNTCQFCFKDLIPSIDALFTFMDCDNNGLVSSKDLYESLPSLRRNTNKWNYFTLANRAKIRSAVTNDFVLKSTKTVHGELTSEEFRRGILYGFWDRQTDKYTIIEDDSRTLKSLRWKDNMIDIAAERYIAALEEAEEKKRRALESERIQREKEETYNEMKQKYLQPTNDEAVDDYGFSA